jgi:hypothetical protein
VAALTDRRGDHCHGHGGRLREFGFPIVGVSIAVGTIVSITPEATPVTATAITIIVATITTAITIIVATITTAITIIVATITTAITIIGTNQLPSPTHFPAHHPQLPAHFPLQPLDFGLCPIGVLHGCGHLMSSCALSFHLLLFVLLVPIKFEPEATAIILVFVPP